MEVNLQNCFQNYSIYNMQSLNTYVNKSENDVYNDIINKLNEAKESNVPIDEGIFKALVGAAAGVTIGPAVMKGVCHVLGIDERGALGNLMTSRLIITALSAYLGWKN